MARAKTLPVVFNLRLDEPLAREIRRIAAVHGTTESEAARTLLSYGAEVERRLQAQKLMRHHAAGDDPRPGSLVIEARWVPASEEELERHDL